MGVVEHKHTRNQRGTVKSWTNLSREQKTALDALAKDNHMSTSEYQRVVLSFAIAHRWGFLVKEDTAPISHEPFNTEAFRSLMNGSPAQIPRKYPTAPCDFKPHVHVACANGYEPNP